MTEPGNDPSSSVRIAMVVAVATIAVAGVLGCGGDKPARAPDNPRTATAPTAAPTERARPEHLAAAGSAIDLFHAALAPRWHAVGPTRMKSTCAALPELTTKAKAVRAAGPPSHVDRDVWSPALARIETGLTGMKASCSGTDTTKFETAFSAVHLAFHDYMDLVVGAHGHGEGDGRGGMRGIAR